MITHNESMGVAAGLVMLIAVSALGIFHRNGSASLRGHGIALIILGIILGPLGFLMSVTWPLTANPPTNIVFGQPTLWLGVIALVGGAVMVIRSTPTTGIIMFDLRPLTWILAGVGLILVSITSAIWSYQFMGTPPPFEPITGQLEFWRNGGGVFTWGLVYLLSGIGCLATPLYSRWPDIMIHVIRWSWTIPGVFFIFFGALNFRTHIGQMLNNQEGELIHRW